MSLPDELIKAEQTIATDAYSMSVGELISSYKDSEIEVHPEFQRFFRWSDFQRTRLVESILLGLPIPPLFVFQKPNGKWELIDGLQRVSTILQFVGELKLKNGAAETPLVLTECKYLPSLKGLSWNSLSAASMLPEDLKLRFRKARLDIKIILPRNSDLSKYELFDRLNTGGSQATPQEVRNCLILMQDRTFFDWMDAMSKYPAYDLILAMTDKQKDEQYNLELLTRFIVLHDISIDEIKRIPDLESHLNDLILQKAKDTTFDRKAMESTFRRTFDILSRVYGESAFRRPSKDGVGHTGPFLLAAYETIAFGVAANIDNVEAKGDMWLKERVDVLWEADMAKSIGRSAASRLSLTIPKGREHFA